MNMAQERIGYTLIEGLIEGLFGLLEVGLDILAGVLESKSDDEEK